MAGKQAGPQELDQGGAGAGRVRGWGRECEGGAVAMGGPEGVGLNWVARTKPLEPTNYPINH